MTRALAPALVAIALVVACTARPGPEEKASKPAERGTIQTRAVNVTRLYEDNCSHCHGANGQGGGAGTPSLLTRDKFDQKWDRPFYDAIAKGVPDRAMPAYGDTLSGPEMWGLVVHLRELQARALRASEGSPKPDAGGVYRSRRAAFRLEDVAEGFDFPWAVDWLPDGRALVTEKGGTMRVLGRDGKPTGTVSGLPKVAVIGQGGLMEVAVSPTYARDGWVYLAFTDPKKDSPGEGLTKIVRGKLTFSGGDASWTGERTVWEAPQEFYSRAGVHFGSRIVFDGKGHLFFAVGERGTNERARDPKTPFGKIFRLNLDGSVPADAPAFPDAMPGEWTKGHRNPQGLAFTPDGRLWDTEHGPRGGDEVNEIARSRDYGWPTRAFSINYNDSPFSTPWPEAGEDITLPIFRWLPSIGACGLDTARGKAFPAWNGDLLAGGLAGQNLDRIRTKDGKLVEREELLQGIGRVRDVAVAPNGEVWLVLNDPNKIVRLVPSK